MSDQEKGKIIGAIIAEMRFSGQEIDEGDMFFALCFKSDEDLKRIAKLTRVTV